MGMSAFIYKKHVMRCTLKFKEGEIHDEKNS